LFVTLQRNNRRATVYFPTLVSNPQENIFVAPGDTIYIYRQAQKFIAVGALPVSAVSTLTTTSPGTAAAATGLTAQFSFDQEHLSLNEAIAKAGGLLDSRADPRQVFLYRMEYREALGRMGVDLAKFRPDQKLIPTIYRANYRDPSSFFLTQQFPMRNSDVIYVANADAIEVVKFLTYVTAITSTVSTVATNIQTTTDATQGRHVLMH
jgi:polysaccharide export outer membrane protein